MELINRMSVVIILSLIAFAGAPAWARKKPEPNPELCQLKTVYVDGNSEAASIVRRELEKRTWLKLENDEAKAEAVLSIAESKSEKNFPIRSETSTVAGQIRRGTKLLWSGSGSMGEGLFGFSGGGTSAKMLIFKLNREAGCK